MTYFNYKIKDGEKHRRINPLIPLAMRIKGGEIGGCTLNTNLRSCLCIKYKTVHSKLLRTMYEA